jgi:hypothetical protein
MCSHKANDRSVGDATRFQRPVSVMLAWMDVLPSRAGVLLMIEVPIPTQEARASLP